MNSFSSWKLLRVDDLETVRIHDRLDFVWTALNLDKKVEIADLALTLEIFLPPLEKCVGYSLKLLDVVQKNWAPQKTLHPSWCSKLVTGLVQLLWVVAWDS